MFLILKQLQDGLRLNPRARAYSNLIFCAFFPSNDVMAVVLMCFSLHDSRVWSSRERWHTNHSQSIVILVRSIEKLIWSDIHVPYLEASARWIIIEPVSTCALNLIFVSTSPWTMSSPLFNCVSRFMRAMYDLLGKDDTQITHNPLQFWRDLLKNCYCPTATFLILKQLQDGSSHLRVLSVKTVSWLLFCGVHSSMRALYDLLV